MIYYKTLKPEIKKGILNRQYSKEQLQQIHDALEKEYRKCRKSALFGAVVVMLLLVLCMVNTHSREEFFIILWSSLILAGVFAFMIFVIFAAPKRQFHRYVHKAYPEYKDSL